MKIQELALIFIIIILPITLVLSVYTQLQIKTVTVQTEYDTKLTAATLDAIKALQINTMNSSTSEIANSKIRDVEASVNTFKESLKSTFSLNGYSEEEMDEYIPAIVYTMYDGFYIYSKFDNTNYLTLDGNGVDRNGETISGLKPYISYSARYKASEVDVVITYALDNFVSIVGTIDGNYVEESGYLVDGIQYAAGGLDMTYNGVNINFESLEEYLPKVENKDGVQGIAEGNYKYVKFNGTKYYLDEANERIFYFLNGVLTVQAKNSGSTSTVKLYNQFKDLIINNRNARQYYADALEFKTKFETGSLKKIKNLTWANAYDYVVSDNGEYELKQVFQGDNRKIFEFNSGTNIENNIENETSKFNQHRLEIIKNKIKTNLSISIANYDTSVGTEFEMPELKDEEWSRIVNNICIISFVQGIDIGGKVYNGYTIVNNSENKEAVTEEDIYILGKDGFYHKIGDKYLETPDNIQISTGLGLMQTSADGRLNLDFERKSLLSGTTTKYYYPLNTYYGSYNSVVNQNQYTDFDDIYKYVASGATNSSGTKALAQAFYTALARERYGAYKDSNEILKTYDIAFVKRAPLSTTYEIKNVSNLQYGEVYTIDDSNLNMEQYNNHSYEFDGWSQNESDTSGIYKNGDTKEINGTFILYPIYISKRWRKVDYYNGYTSGSNVIESLSQEFDITRDDSANQITIADAITQNGKHGETDAYTFVNWKDSSGNTYNPGQILTINQNIQFTAQWKHHEWKLILDTNGGTVAGNVTKTVFVDDDSGDREFNLIAPTRTGYTFLGWYDGSTKVELGKYTISKNVTLQAHWEANTYKITLDVNTGNSINPNVFNVKYDSTINIPVPTKDGYAFMGWYIGDSDTPETSGGNYTMYYAEDITLVAKWTINKYKLILDLAGGTGISKIEYEENYGTMIELEKPTRTHYVFGGWSDGTTIYDAGTKYKIGSKDTTLVAQWTKEKYTLTFNANGGFVDPNKYEEDYMAVRSDFPTPSREGHTFLGWYDSKENGNKVTSYTFTGNKEIFAHWQVNRYTITYVANGGTINGLASISETYNYGERIYTNSKQPVRKEYVFNGWYTSPTGGSQVNQLILKEDTTVYAQWVYDLIEIKYDKNTTESVNNLPGTVKTYKGASVTIPSSKPTRSYYNFLGWATSATGDVVYNAGSQYTFSADTTLYAKWQGYMSTSLSVDTSDSTSGGCCSSGSTSAYTVKTPEITFKPNYIEYSIKLGSDTSMTVKVQGSNGSSWTDVISRSHDSNAAASSVKCQYTSQNQYKYYRLYVTTDKKQTSMPTVSIKIYE